MKKNNKNPQIFGAQKGTTLIEAMIVLGLIGIVTVGMYNMYKQAVYMWNYGTSRMALSNESRVTMETLTRFIQAANGASMKISRYDTNQPVNSYIAAKLNETVYATSTQAKCCGGSSSSAMTVGSTNDYVSIYLYGHVLFLSSPYLKPGTDLTNPTSVAQNTAYQYVTLSTHVDSLMFAFENSTANLVVDIAARFSTFPLAGIQNNPVKIYAKKKVVIKHQGSAGFYAN